MAFKSSHALTWSDIPNLTSLVDRSCTTHITSEFKLSVRYLSWMALQDMNGLSGFCVPNLYFLGSTIAVPSKEPVNTLSPSALKFNETIYPSCPLKVECSLPVSRSHNLAVWSIEPVAHKLLWGSKATATTSFWWPAKVYSNFPLLVSHNLAVQSKLPVTILSLNQALSTHRAHWKPENRQRSYVLPIYVSNCPFQYPKLGTFYHNFR